MSLIFWYISSNHVFPELQTTVSVLALAWVAKNPNTSTVILGASKPEQITENLKAIEVIPKLTPEVLQKIEKILDNEPEPHVRWSCPTTITCFYWPPFVPAVLRQACVRQVRQALRKSLKVKRSHWSRSGGWNVFFTFSLKSYLEL